MLQKCLISHLYRRVLAPLQCPRLYWKKKNQAIHTSLVSVEPLLGTVSRRCNARDPKGREREKPLQHFYKRQKNLSGAPTERLYCLQCRPALDIRPCGLFNLKLWAVCVCAQTVCMWETLDTWRKRTAYWASPRQIEWHTWNLSRETTYWINAIDSFNNNNSNNHSYNTN